MIDHKTIAASNNFIVLDRYENGDLVGDSYQTEYQLESEFMADLVNQGYEYFSNITTPQTMLANVRAQLHHYHPFSKKP